jgi:His/Glu/Gln/Arg/opine family amino acid ABC transporter permease subunit
MGQYIFPNLTGYDVQLLLKGMGTTILITLLAIAIGLAFGFVIGLIRSMRIPVVSKLLLIYIEPIRNSPLVAQLFFAYYGIAMVTNFSPSAFQAAVWTLGINTSAFAAVIVNASIRSVDKGQWEAAYSLGLTYWQTFRLVVVQQAIRVFIPSFVGLCVNQLQVSSLVSLIGFVDLTRVGYMLTLRTYRPFLIWSIVAVLYFVISYPISRFARYAETRVKAFGKIG